MSTGTFAQRVWRFLTSMSFSVAMLAIVAVAAVAGSLVDQNQPYAVYVTNFGTLWADFYRLLGVDDVYHAGWFLLLLATLALCTGLCVWQKAPLMLREMRTFKAAYGYEQVRRVQPACELQLAGDDGEAAANRMQAVLAAHGFRLRGPHLAAHGHFDLTGRKGGVRRLGYLLTHAAIVVICVGGLVDGNLPLQWRLATGTVVPETRQVPASRAGADSRLRTDAGSFRGALRLTPGETDRFAVLNAGDGFLARELPFRVRLKDFRIEYHPSGQPRDFVSEIEILPWDGGGVLRALRLSVNHPGDYAGVQFFQSGFDDGGTRLAVTLLGGDGLAAGQANVAVGDAAPLLLGGEPVRLEATAYRAKNVIALDAPEHSLAQAFLRGARKSRNLDLGPSVDVAVRDAAGQARLQTSYLRPLMVEGRPFFVVGATDTAGLQSRFVRLPLDRKGTLGAYQRVIGGLRKAAAERSFASVHSGGDDSVPDVVQRAVPLLAAAFLGNGFRGLSPAAPATREAAPDASRDVKVELLMRTAMLQFVGDASPEAPAETLRFVADSLLAYDEWTTIDRPPLVKVDAAEPVTATVLQVSQAPGRLAVYAGMACLAAGVILLVLVPERRVWVRAAPQAGRIVLALASHRPGPDAAAELEQVVAALEPHWTKPERRTS